MQQQITDHSPKGRRKTLQTSLLDALRNVCTRESDALWLRKLYTLSGLLVLFLLLGCPVGFILGLNDKTKDKKKIFQNKT